MNNLKSRRTRLEIFAEILEICRKPNVKTRVMYQTNLSYNMLQVCLKKLLKKELLELNLGAKNYSTTERGLGFLQRWEDLQQLTGATESPTARVTPVF